MVPVTTHVLDATTGTPAVGMEIALVGPDGRRLATGRTDDDGRLALGADGAGSALEPGDYTLVFATGAHFAARDVATFYPTVTIAFTVTDRPHHHVPLLLSPFAYSTYRGS